MYAVIGDLVGSRQLVDRQATHDRLVEVLARVDREVPGLQRLAVTVGDEFQGAYEQVDAAARAALLVRLDMAAMVDVRAGIGEGTATMLEALDPPDEGPGGRGAPVQDGPAWWAAREALEHMARPRRRSVRTWFVGPGSDAVNARLICRDALVDRLGERGRRMLALALRGHSQSEIAELEAVSRSAVSQGFARGVGAVRDAEELVRETR